MKTSLLQVVCRVHEVLKKKAAQAKQWWLEENLYLKKSFKNIIQNFKELYFVIKACIVQSPVFIVLFSVEAAPKKKVHIKP